MEDCVDSNSESDKRKLRSGEEDPRPSKKQKWKQRGMNKNRGPTFKIDREDQLCPQWVDRQTDSEPKCPVESCKYIHDLEQYLAQKPTDLGEECYVFTTRGHCPRGVTCRFGSKHITTGGLNIVNKIVHEEWKSNTKLHTSENVKFEVIHQLRKKKYNFDKAESVIREILIKKDSTPEIGEGEVSQPEVVEDNKLDKQGSDESKTAINGDVCAHGGDGNVSVPPSSLTDSKPENDVNGRVHVEVGPILDNDVIKLRSQEKKKIDWRDKLFLSPLTTVGNLPFRRVCKELGADVTCGEMALAVSLLQGKTQEWALTKRHGSEDLFGVQVCGASPNVMTRVAQLVQEQASIDFMDINVGCPIDLIYQQGAGSGLLNKKKVLFSIVKCMKSVLDVPLTVRTRTGVYSGKNVAHTFMRGLADAGADLITVHGRTKEQRYTKLADWDYIEQCAQLAAPTPVVGNGDILSYEDYDMARERSPTATSIMIGRGALIKPWIFTEIKERRHWDISSSERFELLRKYTNYGLEHWGSDTRGVESTRKFLLEWLSFLYRYVPVGLLETPPQKMNERPSRVEGRDDLEILMASPNCADWIKISEMLLGPVPDGFQFIPKHKANAWT